MRAGQPELNRSTVEETTDPLSGLTVVSAPGLSVVVCDTPDDLPTAVSTAVRHKTHALDLAAISFPTPVPFSVQRYLIEHSVLIADSDAESPRARAKKYVQEFIERGRRGADDMQRFAEQMAKYRSQES